MKKLVGLLLLGAILGAASSAPTSAHAAALVIPDRSTDLSDLPAAVCTNQYLKGSGGVYICADAALGTAAAKDVPATGNASATEVVMGSDTRLSETCINTITTPYAVLAVDDSIYVDASGGNKVVNLPVATGSGRKITIKKVDTTLNTVTVTADTEGTPDTIDSDVSFIIANPWTAITVQDAATNTWYVR